LGGIAHAHTGGGVTGDPDGARHRTNCYLNNRLERDHRGIKGRCRTMLGFKSVPSARRFPPLHGSFSTFAEQPSCSCCGRRKSTRSSFLRIDYANSQALHPRNAYGHRSRRCPVHHVCTSTPHGLVVLVSLGGAARPCGQNGPAEGAIGLQRNAHGSYPPV
jgi:hypothetical protein